MGIFLHYSCKDMMAMKKNSGWLAVALVAVLAVYLAGCSSPGMTKAEVKRKHERATQNNMWQIQDDLDEIFLLDRPSRLSEHIIR